MRKVKGSANLYLALIVAAISIIAIIAAITTESGVKNFDQGSPQLAVQKYLQSITAGRNDLAAQYFSKQSTCTVDDIDRAYIDKNIQISLVKTDLDKNVAVVHISIQSDSSLFNGSMNDQEQSIRLIREDGMWKLTGIPWPLYNCGGNSK